MRSSNASWLRKLGWLAMVGGLLLSGRSALAQQVRSVLREAALGPGDTSELLSEYWIGVSLNEVPDALRAQLDLPEGHGALVGEVVPDSPAEKAGLKKHDVVVAVDGKEISSPKEVADAVAAAKDQEISIRYLRGGKESTAAVTPARRPEQPVFPEGQRFLLERDQRRLQDWINRLQPGQAAQPLEWRFFHPGMVWPPGGGIDHVLPYDMTVTITKQGGQPAKVSVKQGDKSWEVTADHLEQLPDDVRPHVESLLGRSFRYSVGAGGGAAAGPYALPPVAPLAHAPLAPDAEARLNQRLEQLERQVREMHEQLEKLLPKP